MTILGRFLHRNIERSFRFPQTLFQRLRYRGIADTADWAWAGATQRYWDWRLGLDTCGEVHGSDITENVSCNGYTPVGAACFESVMRHLGSSLQDVFLDYGSGKGRALLLAARHHFRKCMGVELSDKFCQIARANVMRARSQLRCKEIEVIEGDATEFEVPAEVTVIFLFNPFVGEVFEQVVERIHESWLAAPRDLRIAYIYPADEVKNLFEPCDWITKVHEETVGVSTDHRLVIYRTQSEVSVS